MPAVSPSDRRLDPSEFHKALAGINLYPAEPEECDAGRAIAADLISPHVALAATFRRVHARTGCSVYVSRQDGQVTGVLGLVPLQPAGLKAVEEHVFVARNPPDEHVCAPGDLFPGLYGWGFAASSRKASAMVVMGAIRIREHLADIPFFTRAATPAGVRIICGKMGYRPYPGAPDDLLWHPVPAPEENAA